jgi:hypothetical protein
VIVVVAARMAASIGGKNSSPFTSRSILLPPITGARVLTSTVRWKAGSASGTTGIV